jgi:hypothetical protein
MRIRRHRDAGETLIEVIVAVTIMGLGGVAVIGGIADIRKDSTRQAQVATSYSLLTSFGDQLAYIPGAGCGPSATTAYRSAGVDLVTTMTNAGQLPNGYQPVVNQALCWDVTDYSATGSIVGLVRLDLQVTSPDGYVATLSVVERDPTELSADGG